MKKKKFSEAIEEKLLKRIGCDSIPISKDSEILMYDEYQQNDFR